MKKITAFLTALLLGTVGAQAGGMNEAIEDETPIVDESPTSSSSGGIIVLLLLLLGAAAVAGGGSDGTDENE